MTVNVAPFRTSRSKDSPTVTFYDLAAYGQANTGPFILMFVVKPMKDRKNFFLESFFETYPIIRKFKFKVDIRRRVSLYCGYRLSRAVTITDYDRYLSTLTNFNELLTRF